MSVRELLNSQPRAVKVCLVLGLVLIVGVMVWTSLGSGKPPGATRAYYTTDDGQTTFVDDFFRAYPFDHDGKPAYRVYMFQTEKGKNFVGFLERYTGDGLKQLDPILSQSMTQEQRRAAIQVVRLGSTEIKKPNDPQGKWYRAGSSQANSIEVPVSPDGAGNSCILVFP